MDSSKTDWRDYVSHLAQGLHQDPPGGAGNVAGEMDQLPDNGADCTSYFWLLWNVFLQTQTWNDIVLTSPG